MKDLIENMMNEAKTDPSVVFYMPDVDDPFHQLRNSDDIPDGATYAQLAEMVAEEFLDRFLDIEHRDYSWEIFFEVDGNMMDLRIELIHRNGIPGGTLPEFDHESQILWKGLGMWHYDKHSLVGNDTEVRFWLVNLDEQFS